MSLKAMAYLTKDLGLDTDYNSVLERFFNNSTTVTIYDFQ